jgi:hypothetical protein
LRRGDRWNRGFGATPLGARNDIFGRVVEVLSRGQSRFAGVLVKRGREWIVEPDGRAIRDPIVVRDPGAKNAKEGDKVVFEAKVGGRPEPFVKNRAIFLVADRSLKICGEEDTDCSSAAEPCCGSTETKNQKLLTVQFVGKDGKPLKVGAEGVRGLESRAKIVVEGTVAKVDDKGNVTVTATRIFVEKPEKK